MPIRHGRVTQLLLQRETTFRTAPVTPAAFAMKYNPGFEFGNDDDRTEDPTISDSVMGEKKDEGDPTPSGSVPAILCLNDIGQWLSLLWGAPVTTGVGPYTHTFTASMDARPSALMELGYLDSGNLLFEQWLGVMVNMLSWQVLEKEQNMQVDLIGATQVSPRPSSAFDASPTEYAKNRAASKKGQVFDVSGANTLGDVVEASVQITNDLEGQRYADGVGGFGNFLLGQPAISGSLRGVFDTTANNLFEHGRQHTSKILVLTSKNKAGDASLKLTCPQVEFSEPKHRIESSKGLHVSVDWRAHAAGSPPTIELINGIATY